MEDKIQNQLPIVYMLRVSIHQKTYYRENYSTENIFYREN